MPESPPTFRPHDRASDVRPVERRLYDARWRKARALHLADQPLCEYCALEDRLTAASLVDHLYPHNGNVALFWDTTYWLSCCTGCHNGMKQSIEREGIAALDALAIRLVLPPRGRGSKTYNPSHG
ncbi:MAG TPA: hypothetical protein VNX86_04665 [Rhizomicrobium sp.]|nr:hypothetical protein [Rhizomicrobium sp.]